VFLRKSELDLNAVSYVPAVKMYLCHKTQTTGFSAFEPLGESSPEETSFPPNQLCTTTPDHFPLGRAGTLQCQSPDYAR